VVLVGLPGTGKSTVAKVLAEKLAIPAVDTDKVLEAKLPGGVSDYIVNFGVAPFRAEELQVLRDAVGTDVVLSTGGGVVETPEARQLLQSQLVVWLDAPDEVLLPRLERGNRPLLGTDRAQGLSNLRLEREELYREVSSKQIDASLSSEALAEEISEFLKGNA
jgi:shikimate kinase